MSKWSDIAFGQPVGSKAAVIARALNLGMASLEPVSEDAKMFSDTPPDRDTFWREMRGHNPHHLSPLEEEEEE